MFILKKINKTSKKIYSSLSYINIISRIKKEILKSKKDHFYEVFGENGFYEFYKNGELLFRSNEALDVSPFYGITRTKFKEGEIVKVLNTSKGKSRTGIICAKPLKPEELNSKLRYDYTDNVYLVSFEKGDHSHPYEFQLSEVKKISKKLKIKLNKEYSSYKKESQNENT